METENKPGWATIWPWWCHRPRLIRLSASSAADDADASFQNPESCGNKTPGRRRGYSSAFCGSCARVDRCESVRGGAAASRRTVGLRRHTLCVTHLYTEPVPTHPGGGGRPAPPQSRPGPAPRPPRFSLTSLSSGASSVLPVSGVSIIKEQGEAFLSAVYFFLLGGVGGASGGLRLVSRDPQAAACQPPPTAFLLGEHDGSCRRHTVHQKTCQLPRPPCPNMGFDFSYSLIIIETWGGGRLQRCLSACSPLDPPPRPPEHLIDFSSTPAVIGF